MLIQIYIFISLHVPLIIGLLFSNLATYLYFAYVSYFSFGLHLTVLCMWRGGLLPDMNTYTLL